MEVTIMARCDFCFREKQPLQPPVQGANAKVCKACFYNIDHVVGFLAHCKVEVSYQPTLDTLINTPQTPQKSVSKTTRRKSKPLPTRTKDTVLKES